MSHLTKNCFFDGDIGIARYDVVKYPQFEKLTEKALGYFWRPQEINLTKDGRDFKGLDDHQQHIFTSNLKRQIVLDSKQGRAPSIFARFTSLPEIESFIYAAWVPFEQIHSRSYSHMIKNVYPNPSEVFDGILTIPEILACNKDISKYYDRLERWNSPEYLETRTPDWADERTKEDILKAVKKDLWLCLNAVNALEGIRFYVSFACSWAFAELNLMVGNADIIKLIARDENIHLAFTQQLLKVMRKEDDWEEIAKECEEEVYQIFYDVIKQEIEWARYLFKDGSMIGLNEEILTTYIYHLAGKRMRAIGLKPNFTAPVDNPLPWTTKWIAGSEIQVAPQEKEITSYKTGAVKQDVGGDFLKGLSL